jgi:electron transport complex protein RnfB
VPVTVASHAIEAIDALLPQTQCTRCGFQGCRPYAAALAADEAPLNRCPPGGTALIDTLAALLNRPPLALDPECGNEAPPTVAWIDAEACIGCARCLPPCPVDAIVGAQRLLHTVIASDCTGCELCLPACPVDCIHMLPRSASGPDTQAPAAELNRQRYQRHVARDHDRAQARATLLTARKRAARDHASGGES